LCRIWEFEGSGRYGDLSFVMRHAIWFRRFAAASDGRC
jgi:hypothetical protein